MEWIKGIFAVLAGLINVYKFFKKAPADHVTESSSGCSSEPLKVAERFVFLFESHGIKRSQIPRFFGHDLTLSKLKSNEELLEHLTDEILSDACALFAVRRQWLDGESSQIYDIHDFYKRPRKYQKFLEEKVAESEHELSIWVVRNKQERCQESNAVLIIEEPVGYLEDRQICRYYLCGNWLYNYWKCRAYLAACVAYSQNNQIYPHGRIVSYKWLEPFRHGESFIAHDFYSGGPEISAIGHWEVEDILLLPEAFTDDFSEPYEFSEGLGLWLKLYDEGYLKLRDSHPVQGVRERFQEAYDRS